MLGPRSEGFYRFLAGTFNYSYLSNNFLLSGCCGPSFSGHSFSHRFSSSLTALLTTLSFSLLSRLDRLFYRPTSLARYAVRPPSPRGLVTLSASAGWGSFDLRSFRVLPSPARPYLASFPMPHSRPLAISVTTFRAAVCAASCAAFLAAQYTAT